MPDLIRIQPRDNVAVALRDIRAGQTLSAGDTSVEALEDIPFGHKIALFDIPAGAEIVKYAYPIGAATKDIQKGRWVHTHNVKTLLDKTLRYEYHPKDSGYSGGLSCPDFPAYLRQSGEIGIRNEIWILPLVGCIDRSAERLAHLANARFGGKSGVDGVYAFPHPYGCSQMGDDHLLTQKQLAALCRHPNAGGVLVLGLGCEFNHMAVFKPLVADADQSRIRYLVAQEVEDEVEEGMRLIEELAERMAGDRRSMQPLSKLKVGLKCGGSDGLSGLTANPLLGAFSDRLCAMGGTTVMTEVPEMFGAEKMLMERAKNEEVFEQIVRLINGYKEYFLQNGQVVYENPSPGNKKGGITTLEDKSLGCTQKGGLSPVCGVVGLGDRCVETGLNLLDGPGNDLCAVTMLACAGVHLILFTTGRGTPYGTAVPTLKIATNTPMAERKKNWIDFNAGALLDGAGFAETLDRFFDLVVQTASGQPAKNELGDYREIAPFKNGVTV